MSRGGWYRTDDGRGVMHLNTGRKDPPRKCQEPRLPDDDPKAGSICGRLASALCDAPQCDRPVCDRHRTRDGKDVDYCPRHKMLAVLNLFETEVMNG